MRKLPLLLALLLFAVLATAIPAQAALPADPELPSSLAGPAEEEEGEAEEAEDEEAEASEDEECVFEEGEWLFCDEEEPAAKQDKGKSKGMDDECLLKNAKADVTVNPGKRRLRLSVHYRTWKPATVTVEAVLRGVKGAVHLGTDHARFRRSGVYRDTYELAEKQMKKALAAREVEVELHVVNTPSSCAIELTGASRRAKN
jgi:hypothetical protein